LITGFNTDIKHNDRVYHVQTEDKGEGNPCIESLVYVGGEILASKKTSYAERLTAGADEKTIAQLMELQHKTIIAAVKRGRFDKVGDDTLDRARTIAHPQPEPAVPVIDEEKTLDQVILDYLASEAESEHLELSLADPVEFVSGLGFEVRVFAARSLSQQPIEGATVEVKVISTVEPPRVIFRGTTGADGSATVRSVIPAFSEGTAAVIVSAQSELGNDELKQLVKRKK
jgi:hypothetical protein